MTANNLVEENMNLVYHIISKDYPTFLHDDDIVQSGMVGLCKAANTWDSSRAKFSTYAGRCIRNEIYQEFLRRKPHTKNLSLDAKMGDATTFGETLVGEEDINYADDGAFTDSLSEDERDIFRMDNMGFGTDEIADVMNISRQKVCKTIRLIKLKARNYYGNDFN